ncbi:FCD domain-containing protein [Bradyrhizobium sp. KBS0727]|uniref:FCD domain-containing protein n=1 Tax=unclassified Bradyrhizobium TaxID=2631580 RepID=UPI00110E1AF0|nr:MULTISPECIES: FCD domain-containing protein [unclassified Bradyrhizobium]QDW40551.1 FCD domain-containing protein [Bradyrhizobium sp. KBS0725]QDW47156.1 FCD domain-containing protein [Bradyrhizobium sp. KBS0727]
MSVILQSKRALPSQFAGQEVLEKMRWDILDGVVEPGAKLPFALLQQRYGVGVGTIREGLSHLVSEGLVQVEAGRGYRVAPVSRVDLLDISELRVDFETRALTDAIANGDDAWEVRIVSAFHLLDKLEGVPISDRLRDASRWAVVHGEFHRALVSACRSQWLLHFHSILFDQAERYRLLSLRHRPKDGNRRGEHQAIMEAALSKKVDLACRLAEQHIRRTVEHVLRYSPQLA